MKKTMGVLLGILLSAVVALAQEQGNRTWQEDIDYLARRIEIMHPDPFANCPRETFLELRDLLVSKIHGMSEADIVISISEMLARLRDGHTRMGFENSDPAWLDRTFHLLPFIFFPFDDGIFLLAGLPEQRQWVGWQVVRIGGMPVEEAVRRIARLYSSDNPFAERKNLYFTLGLAEMLKRVGAAAATDRIELTLRDPGGRVRTLPVATVSFLRMAPILGTWYPQAHAGLATMNQAADPLPLWLRHREKKFWFTHVPEDNLMYLQINSLNFSHDGNGESFAQACDPFFAALDRCAPEKLVIDIRANHGGNHVELPLLKGILARPALDQPDRLFLVIGRVTYSAAVHFTTQFKRYTRATVVGEPVSGRPNHYGAIRKFSLPNHPQVVIGCSVDYYQDSQPFDFNISHVPDILAPMTSADYRRNIDPAMVKVREYGRICAQVAALQKELEKEYAASDMASLTRAYAAGKQELLRSGYNPEKFLDEFNNEWFYANKKNPADYLDFLAFAFAECPASIDFCYALAAQLEAQDRVQEAIKFYNQCLQLNPACHYAKMKLGLLELQEALP
jgi:hypothetical protein